MNGQSATGSAGALREELRALARKTRTFEATALAKLAKEEGFELADEEIKTLADELSNELGEDELEQVAGGALAPGNIKQAYDYAKNTKV